MYRAGRDHGLIGLLRRLPAIARHGVTLPWVPPLLLVAVAADDALLVPRAPSYTVLGLLDEPAHLATSLVLLAAITAVAAWRGALVPAAFVAGVVLAGNLIDIDHAPQVLGSDVITAGTPRPYSHSLLTLILLAVGWLSARGLGWRRGAEIVAGAGIGVAGHLLRDLGTAPVALFWPVSDRGVSIPYPAYLAALAFGVGVAGVANTARRRRRPSTVDGRRS
jgi:membrane-bound metal-dependent hydrolase YbcI (DUF457 family)